MNRRLQVFVSSTFTDLIEERQAAVSAILKAGHIPAGMELFTAGDQTQMDIIRQWIDESDVYMLILGGRYGSIEPTSGLSYTELEFDYAVTKGKPLFAVVMKPEALNAKVKARGMAVAESDNKALLRKFEEKVLSNVSSFFEDDKDIKLSVFETLPILQSKREMIGWVRGDQIVDASPFREQNERLSNEVEQLRAKLAAAEQKLERARDPDEQKLREVASTLQAIPLEVPVNIMPEGTKEPWKTDHLDFLKVNSKLLVYGLTNRSTENEMTKYLYWNIANVLAVYGVMKNVKLQGQLRVYEVTPFGQKLFAAVSGTYQRSLEAAKSSDGEVSVAEETEAATPAAAKQRTETGRKKGTVARKAAARKVE